MNYRTGQRRNLTRAAIALVAGGLSCGVLSGCNNATADNTSSNSSPTPASAAGATASSSSPAASAPTSSTTGPPATSSSAAVSVPALDVAPMPAKNVGYVQRTYGPNLILYNGSKPAEKSAPMYVWNFFGDSVSRKTLATNGDGSITLFGGGFVNGQISSASASKAGSKKFVGIAFGGGAYFEAVFKFEGSQGQSTNPNSLSSGFPAFWAMAIEHLTLNGADRWPDKVADFLHFAEFDFFEYNAAYQEHRDNIYTGSVHDWFGEFNKTCPTPADSFCQVQNATKTKMREVGSNFDFSTYHTYGTLWVPATDTEDGYLEWYLDGTAIGQNVIWKKMVDEAALSWPANFAYAVADMQHMALVLGSGTQFPMTIKSVSVWQKSTSGNWVE